MRVLLLKNKTAQTDNYEVLFKTHGFDPVFLPLITHSHVTEEFLELLKEPEYLDTLQSLIVTSQRTVECLYESVLPVLEHGIRRELLDKTIYTVGPVTEDFLRRIGFTHIKGGGNAGNGSTLADIIISDFSENSSEQKPDKLLFLTGEIRRDIIPKKLSSKGFDVQEVVMYRTKTLENNKVRFQDACVGNSWVVFFSPQGTKDILNILKFTQRDDLKIASIGPTTEEYLSKNGIIPNVVSSKPDAENLLSAIKTYL